MGRQNTKPPYYSSLIVEKKQYSTNIPKPVGDKMKERSNSTWKVTFKFEDEKIKLYWEPFQKTE